MRERYPGHRIASSKGGTSQSQTEWECPRCKRIGKGNNWLGAHIRQGRGCKADK